MQADPPYDDTDGVSLGRARFDKRFAGPLEATSHVEMLGARTPVAGSAGYVALERITGELVGKRGSFTVLHTGLMNRGKPSLAVVIVPDSGTGELAGIVGTMNIVVKDGKHTYDLDYELARSHPDGTE
ncbi:MAG: hypothetical protein JWP97_5513 [Labilithrix sp.]|nr:hypothetical protein [Labilithrix sp.]